MKARFGREVLLLCAPIAIILGTVFGWSAWQKRGRTPRIALSVRLQKPAPPDIVTMPFSPEETLRFGWNADLKGGPKSSYSLGWNEQIVALSRGGRQTVVWNLNSPPRGWQPNAGSGSYAFGGASAGVTSAQGLNRSVHGSHLTFEGAVLPLDTWKLEWRGEMVALPSNGGIWQSPMTHAALQPWRAAPGAASWKGTLLLTTDSPGNPLTDPVLMRSRKSETPTPGSKNEIEVEMLSRRGNRRAVRQLVAFDGKTRRVLWTDKERLGRYCQSIGTSGSQWRDAETLSFDVGAVPPKWGEVALECDTVFDVHNRAPIVSGDQNKISLPQLAQFQRQSGGVRVFRRHVLRSLHRKTPAL